MSQLIALLLPLGLTKLFTKLEKSSYSMDTSTELLPITNAPPQGTELLGKIWVVVTAPTTTRVPTHLLLGFREVAPTLPIPKLLTMEESGLLLTGSLPVWNQVLLNGTLGHQLDGAEPHLHVIVTPLDTPIWPSTSLETVSELEEVSSLLFIELLKETLVWNHPQT